MREAELAVNHYADLLQRHLELQTFLDVVCGLPTQHSLFTADH